MLVPGSSRERLAGTLRAAFAEGLLSEQTLAHRLELVFGPRLIEPVGVIGDLALRARPRRWAPAGWLVSAAATAGAALARMAGAERCEAAPLVLALDWSGAQDDLVIGRGSACEIRFDDVTVSRRHARLVFRDGGWMVQDLGSRNGVTVNGTRVGRCRLRPGDRLGLGLQLVDID